MIKVLNKLVKKDEFETDEVSKKVTIQTDESSQITNAEKGIVIGNINEQDMRHNTSSS
ncbi:312_t:CDS:2 [Ambispora leptoticha]|uniref:312_t:CDS:1 n=1 Tax=Ambispora leptoticha TaxID=144679 RepID=A0A9N9A9F1_9GLOM|nr:312_t:CDS:2 [Ambispora leptoticha]